MKFLALTLDIIIGIIGTGWLLTRLSGGIGTVDLEGIWFLLWIAAIVLYFTTLKKNLKMTLGNKIVKSLKK